MSRLYNLELSHIDINGFINLFDDPFQGRLSQEMNYSRVVALAHFVAMVQELGIGEQHHVGIISGFPNEPELGFLKHEKLTILNYEGEISYDLDKSWLEEPSMNFSFTLNNQVLEHVFNPQTAFKNIVHHTAPGGYIWISIPVINCIHGEPYFYSSGFHPRFLERIGKENNLEILHIGTWGSYKYMISAVSGDWLTVKELLPGNAKSYQHPDATNADGRIKDNYLTDCWALYRKPEYGSP